jgi:hypothetical protein
MREEFDLERYGQRWQVETVFSMIKRNLGSALNGRSYWSQCREMMLLAITHNIMIVMPAELFYTAAQNPTKVTTHRGAANFSGLEVWKVDSPDT